LYSEALEKDPEQNLHATILSNRAACFLNLKDYEAALKDCEAVLKIEQSHVKGNFRKAMSLAGLGNLKEARDLLGILITKGSENPNDLQTWQDAQEKINGRMKQREGSYDMMTLPFEPLQQDDVENYCGPIKIARAGKKGRGLFLTRDVKAGELLLAEKALIVKFEKPNHDVRTLHYEKSQMDDTAQSELSAELLSLISRNPSLNEKVSLLSSSSKSENPAIPAVEELLARVSTPIPHINPSFPHLSASTLQGITSINSFRCLSHREATKENRERFQNIPSSYGSEGARHIEPDPRNLIMSLALLSVPAVELNNAIRAGNKNDLHDRDSNGMTALHYSVLQRNPFHCKILLREGAPKEAKDTLGMTPLHYAAGEYYHPETLKALLEFQANPNTPSKRGFTPLHGAVIKAHRPAIAALLSAGANPYAESFMGTPIDLAQEDPVMLEDFQQAGYLPKKLKGSGLWLAASFFNHRDMPNVDKLFVGRIGFFRACQDMKKGTELFIMYHPDREALSKWIEK